MSPRAGATLGLLYTLLWVAALAPVHAQTFVSSQAGLAAAITAAATAIVVNANVTLTTALPVVNSSMSISGDATACAPGLCTVSGGGRFRIFEVYSASSAVTLTLSALGLMSGSDILDGKGGGAVLLLPGASPNWPALVVSDCVFSNNTAVGIGPGGAIAANAAAVVAASMPLTLTNSLFVGNSAYTMAGAVFAYGRTVVNGTSFVSNAAMFPAAQLTNSSLGSPGSNGLGFGGALALGTCLPLASLNVTGGSFGSNMATSGGAIFCGPACVCTVQGTAFSNNTATGGFLVGGAGVAGSGGAVAAYPGASLHISASSFSSHVAGNEGGAVFMSGTKQGSINYALGGMFGFSGHTGFAATYSAIFSLPGGQAAPAVSASPVSAVIAGCTVASALAATGGGVYIEGSNGELNVTDTVLFSTSVTKKGGGIYVASSSNVALSNVTITGGTASSAGGCVAVGSAVNLTITGGAYQSCVSMGTGGGLFADVNSSVVLSAAVLTNNSAQGKGGGIFLSAFGVLTADGVTLAANSAGGGGAVALATSSTGTLSACTLSANTASTAGGALVASGAAAVTLLACNFTGNSVTGLAPHGGAAALENVAAVALAGCIFNANAVVAVISSAAVVGVAEEFFYAGSSQAGAFFLGTAPAAAGGVPMTASINSTVFQGNTAAGGGGALAALAQGSVMSLTLTGCGFSANTAGGSGGALSLSGTVVAVLGDGSYSNNSAGGDGGAVTLLDGCVTASSCNLYTANTAAGHGGALLLQGTTGAATMLTGETMVGNAALYGGAVAVSGAAHNLTLSASSVIANTATYGGVFSLDAVAQPVTAQLALSGATMSGNSASAGALFFSDAAVGQPACSSCVLSNNSASNYGSVIATPPSAFSVESPATVVTDTACDVVITLYDAYGSPVTSWPGFAASLVPAAELSGSLLAGAYANGSAAVLDALVSAQPNTTVVIAVRVTSPALGVAAVGVVMAQCGVNEVFQIETTTCECTRGTFQPAGSSNPCAPCPAGTIAAGIGEVACAACAVNAVSPSGSSVCLACPQASRPVAADLCECETGFFGLFTDTNNGSCTACPANAVCQGGAIVAAPGYWKSSSLSADIQACLEPESCIFDGRTQLLLQLQLSGTDSDVIREAQCWPAYSGSLCSQCSPGYGRDTDLKCAMCAPFTENTLKLAATSFTNLFSLALTIKANMEGGVSPPLHSQIIKVFLNYLTVTSLASRAPLKWPRRVEQMLAVQATSTHSSGKAVALECSMAQKGRPTFYDFVVGYLVLIPVAAVAAPMLFWLGFYMCRARVTVRLQQRWATFAEWWGREHDGPAFALEPMPDPPKGADNTAPSKGADENGYDLDESGRWLPRLTRADRAFEAHLTAKATAPPHGVGDLEQARSSVQSYAVISFVCTIFVLWPPVTSAILHLFVCVHVDPLTPDSPFYGSFLQSDTRERCWEGRHTRYVVVAAAVVAVFTAGIPIGSGLYMWRNRHRLEEPMMNLRYGFIYYGYKEDACYFESIIMLRKLALLVVTVFFSHRAQYAGAYVLCIMLGVMFASFFVHARLRPYKEPILDRLERNSMSASILTLHMGLFFYLGVPYELEVVMTVLLAATNAAMCVSFVTSILSEFVHAKVLASMPPGSTRANVTAVAMVDHCIYRQWPRVARVRGVLRRRVFAAVLLRFIHWLDHDGDRRSMRELMDHIPTALREMRAAADATERVRRGDVIKVWAAAGVISDAEVAAWVCWFEGAARAPAALKPLVDRSCQREADSERAALGVAADKAASRPEPTALHCLTAPLRPPHKDAPGFGPPPRPSLSDGCAPCRSQTQEAGAPAEAGGTRVGETRPAPTRNSRLDAILFAPLLPPTPPTQAFAPSVEEAANSLFRELYSGTRSIPAAMDALSTLRRGSKREHEIYACVLRNLFSKYRSFPTYPDKDLRITASLLGSLVAHRLVRGTQLGLALRFVLDGLRKPPGTKMFAFGADAVAQLHMRVHEWPQFCAAAVQIQHLSVAAPELVAFLKRAQLGMPVALSSQPTR